VSVNDERTITRGSGRTGAAHEDHHGAGFLTIGNFLSLLRIPLGFMFLVVDDARWVAAIVVVGAATDLLDGFAARLTHTESEIGALLDPFCDRIFVFLALVSFLPTGRIDWAGFLILILRDIFTGGVFLVGRLAGKEMPAAGRQGDAVPFEDRREADDGSPGRRSAHPDLLSGIRQAPDLPDGRRIRLRDHRLRDGRHQKVAT